MKLPMVIAFALFTGLTFTACATPGSSVGSSGFAFPTHNAGFDRLAFPSAPRITNPYLPYVPGTKYVYDGTLGKLPEHDVQLVTHDTRVIAGVPCVVVVDTGYVNNKVEERTDDYYAQDFYGNVWYFGEYETSFHPRSHK